MDPDVLQSLPQGLATVLTRITPEQRRRRIQSVTGLVALAPPTWSLLAPAAAHSALDPVPEPLPAQLLVDLLKQPLCVGEPRRQVLEQLGRHYRRQFANQWDFVRFATEHNLGLDFTSPPQRP
jgi:hypothetical protein